MAMTQKKPLVVSVSGDFPRKPGPKSRHSGMFVKGDPRINCGGRPRKSPQVKALEALCRELTDDAVDVLRDAMTNPKAPLRDRMAAALAILDRGHGKPVDRQQLMTLDIGAIGGQAALSDDQLLRIAAGALGQEVDNPREIISLHAIKDSDPPPSTL